MTLLVKKPIKSIRFETNLTTKVLKVGMIFLLKAYTNPAAASVTFQSSDNSILRLYPDETNDYREYASCLVEVVGVGKASISVKGSDNRFQEDFVTYPKDYQTEVCNRTPMVSINTDYLKLYVGEVFRLQAITNPLNQSVKWKSKNGKIATVDKGGWVTGCARGCTEIICSYAGYQANCIVEVTSIDIQGSTFRIGIGEKFRIPIGNYPASYDIIWTSTNPGVAKIDRQGIVEGSAIGDTTITAVVETETGPTTRSCNIEVHNYFEPWQYFNKERLAELKTFDKEHELMTYCAGREFRKVQDEDMPTLYYIRTSGNPYLYDYEVAAVDDDINKFLLFR